MLKLNFYIPMIICSFITLGAHAADSAISKADLKIAAKDYKKVCLQCHAKDGMGKAKLSKKTGKFKINAMAGPQIAGLSEKYITEQVLAIQAGTRKNKNTISMKQNLKRVKPKAKRADKKLLPEDVAALAHYISKELNKKAGPHKGMEEK